MLLAMLIPAWLGRQVGHIGLTGHALQMLALTLAVRVILAGLTPPRALGFISLGVTALGVHAYHVPVITLLFGAALVSRGLQKPGIWPGLARWGVAYVTAMLAAMCVLGYFVGRGVSGGAQALGVYEMNLIAPFLPQGSALAGQRWAGGWFTHTFDPTGGQSFEGYNYQGAGVLLLLAAAGVMLWRRRHGGGKVVFLDQAKPAPPVRPAVTRVRRWGPLVAALALLVLYAVGTNPYLGPVRLFSLPLPSAAWMEPLALFRCHGRFFWTVGYALLAGALVTVDRLEPPPARHALLAAAVAMQAADMSQMLYGLHEKFSQPDALVVPPELTGPMFKGRDYRFFPGFYCTNAWNSQQVVRQLSIIAQRQQASTNSAITVRPPRNACPAPPADALRDAAPGDDRITVLTSEDGQPSAVTRLFAGRSDCRAARDFWLCGHGLSRLSGTAPAGPDDLSTPGHVDVVLPLGTADFRNALARGWSTPESTGVWSDGPRAVLRLPVPPLLDARRLGVVLEAIGYQPAGRAPQRVEVSVDGRRLAEWRLEGGGYQGRRVSVPADLLAPGRPLELVLDLPDAVSPDAVRPGSGDPRRLGVGVRRIALDH